ncbi:ABC transporter permease [Kitasatospora aureofaciens]|uniref:Sugar ABC transporter permease n=1 Tax=Streptomyces rimosus subsp. rimosus (strain ATCC 10970 / DSM 40260 / JCM 4667 / NRRL 2234) TaxID=1265868 RepID=A0A8A1V2K1_STRR1|nr:MULTISPECIES: sugar ABC transporter permease [Streptomyces]KOG69258.1 ABC transporter permease [Kitasatospora aureofaciens]MYT40835.1 ABC transporter permease subunit [Streptomyces sp. SID5471]KEF22242.1 ABC transporter permease [Streptomyces rimosus]KUJ30537.1 ABC transporter permease [Streptomyces rimosus subsp. rimosus]QDA10039.1 sugar ABC transporter permease [Streptomyces rimosus]
MTPRPARRRGPRRHTHRDLAVLCVLLGLPILLDLALVWGPTLASVALSFTTWDGVGDIHWAGLNNYADLFADYPQFWPAVRNNLLWLAALGLLATPFGLLLAVLIDRGVRFSRLYQSTLYMPVVLSLAVVGFIAQLILSRDQGALNALLGRQDHPVDWLGDPDLNIWMILLAACWRHTGYVMILYLAGLKSVDPELKEAAAIDGANERQAFFRVVLPALRPVNVIVGVITVIEALRAFDIVYAVNKGRNGLELLSVLVTDNIIGEASRIGFGSAIAVVLLLVSLGFIITYLVQELRGEQRR